MTDLVPRTDIEEASGADASDDAPGFEPASVGADVGDADAATVALDATRAATASGPAPSDVVATAPVEGAGYAWAPVAPSPRTRHLGLWIGLPAAAVAVALVASSLVLIAPGTAVAGVPIGGMTAGGAADAIQSRLARTTVTLTGVGGDATVTAAQLGASVDARALAQTAYSDHPMWNIAQWFRETGSPEVTLDPTKADAVLRTAVPSMFTAPKPASVAFDQTSGDYVVTPAVAGTAVDLGALQRTMSEAFADGAATVSVTPARASVDSKTSTANATKMATALNTMLDTVGFYVGDERTVPVDRAVAASWLTVSARSDGSFAVTADKNAIQKAVDALPAAVNRAPADGKVITNSSGTVLRTIAAGLSGRTLGDTSGVAAAFATQLAGLHGVYTLPVTETAAATVTIQRLIEVNLTTQTLYMKENGQVVDSWLISSGHDVTPTYTGHYRINSHIPLTTMTGNNVDGTTYVTPNVPWVMYFNGGEGFHGVYWHHNWGHKMSHGCVGMPIPRAKELYDWAPGGADVWIHN